MFIFFLFSVWI